MAHESAGFSKAGRRRFILIGRAFLYAGQALILAAALRAIVDLLKFEAINIWSVALAVGCILASIRLGFTEIRASTDALNTASVRVLDKLGFNSTGRSVVGGLDTIFFSLPKQR